MEIIQGILAFIIVVFATIFLTASICAIVIVPKERWNYFPKSLINFWVLIIGGVSTFLCIVGMATLYIDRNRQKSPPKFIPVTEQLYKIQK